MRKKLIFALMVLSSTCLSICVSPEMSGDPFLQSGAYEQAEQPAGWQRVRDDAAGSYGATASTAPMTN